GRPSAPRPAPLTELHQRVEEASDRHQEVGKKHVLQLQLHGRAAGAGGVRRGPAGTGPPAPRPSRGPRPARSPAFPAPPCSSSQEPGSPSATRDHFRPVVPLPKNTIPSNSSRHYHSKYHEVPTLYSRDPGGPLVLKSHKSSGIDTEQKTAILQQVKAERPCCQNDF
ncbi:hypothetical protein U0070_002780, partial [Myodes glareolus]